MEKIGIRKIEILSQPIVFGIWVWWLTLALVMVSVGIGSGSLILGILNLLKRK